MDIAKEGCAQDGSQKDGLRARGLVEWVGEMSSVAQYLVGPPRYEGSTIATCYLSRESTGVNKYSLYSRAEDVGRPLLLLTCG